MLIIFVGNHKYPIMKRILAAAFAAALILLPQFASAQKWEGLARTPQMGWNSWNKFAENINEQLIRETADALVEKGLAEAGYVYLNIDDCWHGERDEMGFITESKEKFPSGMKALGDYIHSKGLKFGIYSDAGDQTCACYPGSLGHEYQDAYTYAHWGVDYLKYDWCFSRNVNPKGAYSLISKALRASGRPILLSMCEWGSNQPWEWAAEIGHSWRTTGDICASFEDVQHYDENGNPTWRQLGVVSIIDLNAELRQYAGPDHWNDPDMLEVGNGMSVAEDRAHFSLWCMMAAPLILGNDLTNMTQETYDILTNREVIAIDQDALGIQGLRYRREGDIEYWFKPLAGGSWAFCVFNRGKADQSVTVDWENFCFTDELSGCSTAFDSTVYTATNLWNKSQKPFTTRGKVKGKKGSNNSVVLNASVPAHDVIVYRLDPVAVK